MWVNVSAIVLGTGSRVVVPRTEFPDPAAADSDLMAPIPAFRFVRDGSRHQGWIPSMEYIHGHPFDQASAVPVIMLATALLVAGAVLIYQRLEL